MYSGILLSLKKVLPFATIWMTLETILPNKLSQIWRRKWQPTPVFLPVKSCGQRSLVAYHPWGRKESDTTERLHFTSLHFICISEIIDIFPGNLDSSLWYIQPGILQDVFCIFGEGNGNPLQYSCPENPVGWRSLAGNIVHRVVESDTTEQLHFSFCI